MRKLLLSFVSFFLMTNACAGDAANLIIQSGKIKHGYTVEIADNDLSREKGLMYRKTLAPDRGMLFVFKRLEAQNFWMKNTLIPLDIVFIDAKGRIVKIHERAEPEDETLISSGQPVAAALELKGGEAARAHLKIGDKITRPAFPLIPAKPVAKN